MRNKKILQKAAKKSLSWLLILGNVTRDAGSHICSGGGA